MTRWDRSQCRRVAGALATVVAVSLVTSASGLAPSVLGALGAEPATSAISASGTSPAAVVPPVPESMWSDPPTAGAGQPEGSIAGTPAAGNVPEPRAAVPDRALAAGGEIPEIALRAYQAAAHALSLSNPACGLDFALLAGIGKVESNHGRYAGAQLGTDGVSRPLIIGIPLDGRPGVARIVDSDRGQLDGDLRFDRAVGPMQFIPGTWVRSGADGDGDGRLDPHDLDDAALAAGRYLCGGGSRVDNPIGALAALMRYNHSGAYGVRVLGLAQAYRSEGSGEAEPFVEVEGPQEPPVWADEAPGDEPLDEEALGPDPEDPAPIGDPVAAPADPAGAPVADPATDPVTDPAPDPATDPAPDPAVPPAACPLPALVEVVDPTGEPAVDPALPADPGVRPPVEPPVDPDATPPAAAADPCDPMSYGVLLVQATNDARAAEGLPPLIGSECAQVVALERAAALAGLDEPTPADPAAVLAACAPAASTAELLSRAAATPSDVVTGWLGSATSRADLFSPVVTEVGVGCVLDGDEMLCVQVLLGR